MRKEPQDAIAVVDFGGQYAHLIAAKVRHQKVRADILQPEDPTERFAEYKGIILSGSPALASQGQDSDYNKQIYELEQPILGLCFGHQEIAKHYGGRVVHGGREWGPADLHIGGDHPLFRGLGPVERVWMSHFDSVTELGPDFKELGHSVLGDNAEPHRYAAIGSDRHRRYGFQFHAEVDDTVHGDQMLANFVYEICGCKPSWTMERYLEQQLAEIKRRVGDGSVFLLASGGVDSTVAAVMFGSALGNRLRLLHVDNGLMRKGESQKVLAMLRELGLGDNLHFVDASDTFLAALEGATEPEIKRAIIGQTFVDVFEREAKRLDIEDHLLGQGTIYPDTIETGGTRRADTIKTHHNRVPVIERMIEAGRVVEPLAELYKAEVRELGQRLNVPAKALQRHPFPGPGLGVRLLCASDADCEETLPAALEAEAQRIAAEYGLTAQALPIRSVGVKADLRCYEHPVLLTGDLPWDKLLEAAASLAKQVEGINRCLWNLQPSSPKTVRPVASTVTRPRLDVLREADARVMEGLRRHGLYDTIWQCPTVLAPVAFDDQGTELCIVRPVHSVRAMTATAAQLPTALLEQLRDQILALPTIGGLALDLTSKPPGTIEWE